MIWTTLMLVSAGLFAGGALTIAWAGAPVLRAMPPDRFIPEFARTIRTADKVQPALAVIALATSIVVSVTSDGAARFAAATGAAVFLAIVVVSGAVLVPLQRRIVRWPVEDAAAVPPMRERWIRGHAGRSALSLVALAAVVVAAVL